MALALLETNVSGPEQLLIPALIARFWQDDFFEDRPDGREKRLLIDVQTDSVGDNEDRFQGELIQFGVFRLNVTSQRKGD